MAEFKINIGWQTITKAITVWPIIVGIWVGVGWLATNKDRALLLLNNAPRIIEAVDMILTEDEDGTPEYEKQLSRAVWIDYHMEEDTFGLIEDDLKHLWWIECKEHPEECN
ncbi:hypothetical protein KAR91_01045 [Candidatus Pacearchaeota archaeon]|nr:hypothetical protein [Candidatus Pacearchaeota archaeon]